MEKKKKKKCSSFSLQITNKLTINKPSNLNKDAPDLGKRSNPNRRTEGALHQQPKAHLCGSDLASCDGEREASGLRFATRKEKARTTDPEGWMSDVVEKQRPATRRRRDGG